MAKKSGSTKPRGAGATRKTAGPAKSSGTTRKKTATSKTSSTRSSVKKHVGDVLGISRARVSKSVPSGGGRAKGIEVTRGTRRKGPKPARTVGGVRGRGR